MSSMSDFRQANAALERYWPKRLPVRLRGTERMRTLLHFLGNPQEKMRVVHVAGTSGKTSTSYYAASLLHTAGHSVGLVTSPHLDEINERVQINMVPLAEQEFCRDLEQFLALVEASGAKPHYFEVMVAFAFWEFARHQVEYAVVEVGMGGLTDSTNVVEREDKLCVITDVGLDHTKQLGNTLAEIATQKAGIIQWHNTVFCYRQSDPIMHAIQAAAQRRQADLHIVDADVAQGLRLDFLPLFQRRNFSLAYAAVAQTLRMEAGFTNAVANRAAHVRVPGRMEIIRVRGKTVVLDAAHNPQKMAMLAKSMRAKFGDVPTAALVSIAPGETRAATSLRQLVPLAEHVVLTSFGRDEHAPFTSISQAALERACRTASMHSFAYVSTAPEALEILLARPEPVLLITGSLFLLAEVRGLLASAV